jgi:hypothetical protein
MADSQVVAIGLENRLRGDWALATGPSRRRQKDAERKEVFFMATATQPSRNLEQSHQKVRSPLAQLRGLIRSYVSLEGLALAGLYLALWFWIGMLLDYGFFRAFTVDWVQELPWGMRAGMLIVILSGLLAAIALVVVRRFFKEFSDPAVALVLERRFPKQLGDRLITAVELSDPKQAAEYGYSPAMVRQTIHDAADRVQTVPVKQVFDWGRLIRRGVLFLGLSAGLYVLACVVVSSVRAMTNQPPLRGIGQVNEVSTIWFERNVLLRNTIWPRRAHIVLVDWKDDLKIAKETTPPTLRARAWKYTIADESVHEGIRPLTWEDVGKRTDLFGDNVPPAAPEDWKPRDPEAGLSVDEVELQLSKFEVRDGSDEGSAKWQIASASDESGWRPLMWNDLSAERLGGMAVPKLPGDWVDPKAWPFVGLSMLGLGNTEGAPLALLAGRLVGQDFVELSLDEVEKQLNARRSTLAKGKGKEIVADVDNVFARLKQLVELRQALARIDERVSDPALSRKVRKLIVPETLTLVYKGQNVTNTVPLNRTANNEFTGNFNELKESVTFTVRGEDYSTARRTITAVELPRLDRMVTDEERPAYLYYRPDRDGKDGSVSASDLRGKRQRFEGRSISVSGGEASTIEVPSGTSLVLNGTLNKPLEEIWIVRQNKGAPETRTKAEKTGETEFQLKLDDVRNDQRFTIEFTDTDGVKGRRTVLVKPEEDAPPRIRDFGPDEIIRRTKEGFMVTPNARVPFKGVVRDREGLGRVRYAYTVGRGDFLLLTKAEQAIPYLEMIPLLGPRTYWGGVWYGWKSARDIAKNEAANLERDRYLDVEGFNREVQTRQTGGRGEVLSMETMTNFLRQPQRLPFRQLLNDFKLEPDKWTEGEEPGADPRRWKKPEVASVGNDLPLWKLRYYDRDEPDESKRMKPLKEQDLAKSQKRFQMEVWLEAEDTDVEGEVYPDGENKGKPKPHLTRSGETFTFIVVPENELRSKIGEEQDAKRTELLRLIKPIAENTPRMTEMKFSLSGEPSDGELKAMGARAGTLDGDVLIQAQKDLKSISSAYERILREMRTNQINEDQVASVYNDIVKPLEEIDAGHFPKTRDAMAALQKLLEDGDQSVAARTKKGRERVAVAQREMSELLQKLNKVLEAMEGQSRLKELLDILIEIEKSQEQTGKDLDRLLADAIERILKGGGGKNK